jgi:hypothetical protein
MKKILSITIALLMISPLALAEPNSTVAEKLSPDILPGNGIKQHDFVYAGEWDTRKPEKQSLFIVRNGKVDWSIQMPLKTPAGNIQEYDDATLLPDGSVIYARMSGAGRIAPDKTVLWDYPAPENTEIHSIQSIGQDLVLIAQNGTPAQAIIINTKTREILKRVLIPTQTSNSHGQMRHIRMTKNHTIIVPLLSEHRVIELSLDGKEIWSVNAQKPWRAVRLRNGNTLISGDKLKYVREVNRHGKTVWEFTEADVPEYRLHSTQAAYRLKNGNTIITNWVAGNKDYGTWPNTVQAIEVTREKKVVWALRSWNGDEDLGPATHIQLLDQEEDVDAVHYLK